MGIIMNRNQTKLLFGIALSISGLFASQTMAASGCITAACDPAAAAACEPAAAACEPAPVACEPACAPTCTVPVSCDTAAAAACNSGCLLTAPGCGVCSACGNVGCKGHCGRCGCADLFFGKLFEGTCWSGYANAGYFTNFKGDRSNGYTDCWSETTPAFNALYVSATKKAFTGGCGYDFGYGVDFMFGEDSRLFRSAHGLDENWYTGHMSDGRPSYGFAMPQLYLEAAFNNWSVKAGHFFGLLGYEGATANSRFFYTKGLLCSVSPVAQTGALVTYSGFQNLDMTLGWINGWGNGFSNEYGEGMVEGAFTYHMNECSYIKYAFLAGTCDIAVPLGALGPIAPGHACGDASVHTLTLDVQLTQCLESVTLFYYGDFDGNTVTVWGQHLYRDINCCTKFGFRGEWLKTSIDDTELTTLGIGLNYHPYGNQNLFIRPEFRYDKTTNAAMLNGRPDQFTIGFDVMMTF